jgi:hypothetical protein
VLGDGLVGRMGYVDGEAFMLLLLRSKSCVAAEVGDNKSVDVVKSELESFFLQSWAEQKDDKMSGTVSHTVPIRLFISHGHLPQRNSLQEYDFLVAPAAGFLRCC